MTRAGTTPQSMGIGADIDVQEKTYNIQKTRVQIDLTPRAMRLLNELKEKTDAVSNAEVIRDDLKLYDGLITEMERGSEFMTRDKMGKVSNFKIFV